MEFNSHGIWGQGNQLENGIAANGMSGKENLTKIEFINQNVYHVRSTYVEVDGYPYLLELVDQITEETLLGGHGRDEVIKYITVHDFRLYVDILTGIYNRRYYEEQLRDMSHVSAAAMIDMDHFNAINDTYGHPVGDLALKQAAKAIKNCVKRTDSVVRFGGDEIFVVFGDIPFHMLQEKLEEIRSCVNKAVIPDYPQLKLSISIGGVYGPGQVSDLMEAADRLLFQVKREKAGLKIKEKMNERL